MGDIQAHMLKQHSKPSTRRQDIIHPSEMAKASWCPLATYLRIARCRALGDPYWKLSESIGVQLLNIFDEGHYIHDKWQKRLTNMGDLWGNWRCVACDYLIKDFYEYDDRCPSCKSHVGYNYAEIPLKSPRLLISGHADGGVPRLKSLIEIKSVGVGTARIEAPDIYKANSEGQKVDLQGLWKDIKEPFPSHIRQGQLYLYLWQQMEKTEEIEVDFDRMIFLYESKFNQGAKEFVVNYDYEVVKPLIEYAEQIVAALDSNEPINCPYGGCKECELYGAKNDSVTTGLGRTTEQDKSEGTKSPSKTIRRSSRPASRLIRPS